MPLFAVRIVEGNEWPAFSEWAIIASSLKEAWQFWLEALDDDTQDLLGANPREIRELTWEQAKNHKLSSWGDDKYTITLTKQDSVVGKAVHGGGG
jgi:hypothetical protein